MGRLDNLPDKTNSDDPQAAERLLRSVTQDLKNLQQDLVAQLQQDVRRLQAEKSRLLNDIEKLQNQQQALQNQHEVALSRQQQAQQQAWAKQLALALANHLHVALNDRLSQTLVTRQMEGAAYLPQLPTANPTETTDRTVAALDDAVSRAFTALRHDLNSYQSSLSQQISRMQDLGQQGEVLLEVLVGRISQYLQLEAAKAKAEPRGFLEEGAVPSGRSFVAAAPPSSLPAPAPNPSLAASPTPVAKPEANPGPLPTAPRPEAAAPRREATAPSAQAEAAGEGRSPSRSRLSHFQLGLGFVLLSTLALALHTVVVFIVGNRGNLFGTVPVGGYLELTTLRSSLLLLWVRTLVVVPLMVGLARRLYPPAWRDIKAFSQSTDRRLLWSVIASGFFMFLSQTFVYLAIGQLGPGLAITILFAYPMLTIPLMWLLFGDRPSRLRLAVIGAIAIGVGLAAYPALAATTLATQTGLTMAIAAGVAFALYLVAMQISFRKLHPVPVSLIQFISMFVFTSLSLIVLGVNGASINGLGLAGSGIILGGLTVLGYLLNDWGIRLMGAARAAIIAASVPALTALLAFLIIPGALTALHSMQIAGILAVTLGGSILGLERLLLQAKAANRKHTQRKAEADL